VFHGLQRQRGRDQEGASVVAQHRIAIGPDEATCQGHRRHVKVARCYAGFCFDGGCAPRRSVVQVRDERGPLGCVAKVQRPGKDQARLG
jgi:hypothetical protein